MGIKTNKRKGEMMEIHKEIILTEDCLDKCFVCGNKIPNFEMYKYYCSKECENKDNKRIQEMIGIGKHPVEIMNDALKNIINPKTKQRKGEMKSEH